MPTAQLHTASDGRQLTFWHWPAKPNRDTLHWAHANGFNGRIYKPLLDKLAMHFNVIAWDMRGQGCSRDAGVLSEFHHWSQLYDDLADWLLTRQETVWLAGHSMGGTSSMAVAARHPELVKGVVLCDPVLLGWKECLAVGLARLVGQAGNSPLSKGARARRATFDSRQAAYKNYRRKKIFSQWPDEWLQNYAEYGFVDNQDGTVSLACSPEWEAKNFENVEHRPGRAMGRCGLPMLALGADKRSTFSADARKKLLQRWPNSKVETVAGSDHFLPMSHSEELKERILEFSGVN